MAGSNHGGARPGAGRPSNPERHREAIASFTDLAARGLEQCLDNLFTLADGGFERTEVEWAPAGTVTRKEALRDADGNPILNRAGGPVIAEVLAFPGLPADQLVQVRRKVITLAPDFRANEYLVNRVIGRPREEAAPDREGLDFREALRLARLARQAYVDPDAPPPEADDEGGPYCGA